MVRKPSGTDKYALSGITPSTALDDELTITAPEPVEEVPATVAPPPVKIVPVSVLVTPEDRKRLKLLSVETGLSIQKLMHEALNQMLETRGLPPLEPVSANVPSGRLRR